MAQALMIRAVLAAALTMFCSGVWAKETSGQQFITKAIRGNLSEVAFGRLAQQKAANDSVRSFGQTLEQDHAAANQQAAQAAAAVGVTPPTEPDRMQKAVYDRMSKLSGNAFDREFARHMVADHRKDISTYQKEAKRSDAQVSDYAKATLPTLQKHLEAAQSLVRGASASR
jgi:putative membrane protein